MTFSFEELLERDGLLVYRTRGKSMLPMLHQARDLVNIEPVKGLLMPLDVVFYKRGTSYVLHRIVRIEGDLFLIRGDNTYSLERVHKNAILGKLVSFVRKGKSCQVTDRRYLRYVVFWNGIYPVRAFLFRFKRLCVRILKKLGLYEAVRKLLHRD